MSFYNHHGLYVFGLLLLLLVIKKNASTYDAYFSQEILEKIRVGANQRKIKFVFLILAFCCFVLALSRPVVENRPLKITKEAPTIFLAFDLSTSMMAKDIYPNRFIFAINKANQLLEKLTEEQVAAIGFHEKGFLVSPLTNDYETLRYLISNIPTTILTKDSSFKGAILSIAKLSNKGKTKALVIFSDGGLQEQWSEEITLATKNNIKIFVYAIGTKKGAIVEGANGVELDLEGKPLLSKLNEKIANLALQTDGAYLEGSNDTADIALFLGAIRQKLSPHIDSKKEIEIINNDELYWVPLLFGMGFFLLGVYGVGALNFKRGLNR